MTDHGVVVVVNVYVPFASGEDEERVVFKSRFTTGLLLRCQAMRKKGREVVLVGDLNVAAEKIDHCSPGPEFDKSTSVRRRRRSSSSSSGGGGGGGTGVGGIAADSSGVREALLPF